MRPALLRLEGFPSRTISIQLSEVPIDLPRAELVQGPEPVIAIIMSCEVDSMRWTVGQTAPSAVGQWGHVMFPSYTFIRLENPELISSLQMCNATVGQQANTIAHITFLFGRGV